MYHIPQFKVSRYKKPVRKILKNPTFRLLAVMMIALVIIGFNTSTLSLSYLKNQIHSLIQKVERETAISPTAQKTAEKYISKVAYEQAIIDTVKEASPSVVSIIISKNMPVYEQQFINPFEDFPGFGAPLNIQVPQYIQKGTEKQEIGSGSGFIVSSDGLILTNKHVVVDKEAQYTVLTNDGKKYSAKVLALDPVQDLAIIKIQGAIDIPNQAEKFKAIKLGDSSSIQIGQTAIAIGNALGEFRNTVSVGVISGLGRTISASGAGGFSETLESIIQTDAAINLGNSGGPLLNLDGEVIGINTATAQGAQSIGFAVPINIAKKDINQVIKNNKIVYPFLGVRYTLVDEKIKVKYQLPVDYGALVLKGSNGEPAVTKDSAADKAGLRDKDLILEMSGEKITKEKSLASIVQNYNPGDTITLKVWRNGKEIMIDVILGERN